MTTGRIPSIEGGIQPTIVDAKGDLITATAADTPARLAVGSNGDTLVADSAATTGLRWSSTPSASNPVLNGAFDIWQRGTSFTATSVYTADRWYRDGNSGRTFSRQVTNDTTNLAFIQYCMRAQRDSGNSSTNVVQIGQSFESVNSIPYAGKTITFSFYARAGANYSAASGALAYSVRTGTGTDQNLFSGYTGQALPINTSAALTTTWQRFTASATLSSSATELGVLFEFTPVGTAGAADYFEVTGVQIDVGSVALPFRRSGDTIQGELAACQRYFSKSYNSDVAPGTVTDVGATFYKTAFTDSFQTWMVFFPVQMRSTPTMTFYSPADGATGNSSVSGTNRATTAAGQTGASGTGVYINNVSIASANLIKSHWTASIEL